MDNELDMIVHIFNPSTTTKTAVAKLAVCRAFTRLDAIPISTCLQSNSKEVAAGQTKIRGRCLQLHSQSGLGNLPEASLPFLVITSGLSIYTTIHKRPRGVLKVKPEKIESHQTSGSSHNYIEALPKVQVSLKQWC